MKFCRSLEVCITLGVRNMAAHFLRLVHAPDIDKLIWDLVDSGSRFFAEDESE